MVLNGGDRFTEVGAAPLQLVAMDGDQSFSSCTLACTMLGGVRGKGSMYSSVATGVTVGYLMACMNTTYM